MLVDLVSSDVPEDRPICRVPAVDVLPYQGADCLKVKVLNDIVFQVHALSVLQQNPIEVINREETYAFLIIEGRL